MEKWIIFSIFQVTSWTFCHRNISSRKMTKKHTFWFGFLARMNLNSCFSNFDIWIFNINNILALFQTMAFIIRVHKYIYRIQFKSKHTSGFIGLHYFWYHDGMTFGKCCHLKADHCICCLIWIGRYLNIKTDHFLSALSLCSHFYV